jgi:hypothetical protein
VGELVCLFPFIHTRYAANIVPVSILVSRRDVILYVNENDVLFCVLVILLSVVLLSFC